MPDLDRITKELNHRYRVRGSFIRPVRMERGFAMRIRTSQLQMSESFWTITCLTLSGAYQDAYSYFARGKVFANAQTGNIVLMAAKFAEGDFLGILHYLFPIIAFACGIAAAAVIHRRYKHSGFHWRQGILVIEILLLMCTPWIGNDSLANCLVSFACALQVQSFRKVHGFPFASTMCIGNLRSMMDHLVQVKGPQGREHKAIAFSYFRVLMTFMIGAGIGKAACDAWGLNAIYGSCLFLVTALLFMFYDPRILKKERIQEIDEAVL